MLHGHGFVYNNTGDMAHKDLKNGLYKYMVILIELSWVFLLVHTDGWFVLV